MDVHKWINTNVRNILDESDAILQANSQLIYTVGNQELPDGKSLRWLVPQALLKNVPHHMKRLISKFGRDKIEFDGSYVKNGHVFGAPTVDYRSDVFAPCRILDEAVFYDLRAALIDDFFENKLDIQCPETNEETKKAMRSVLCMKGVDKQSVDMVNALAVNERDTILILSGLLRFEVLKLALTRRWRVNYGVDSKGQRKMAIPFKAKDVAAEMTEFGHPDVAICLTQLTYYYSGLSDKELHEAFLFLDRSEDPNVIYKDWIREVPAELVPDAIKEYTGVNLSDAKQRIEHLFPILRRNMYVIDYWLSHVVFPREAKLFDEKLMCTVWDLCNEQLQHKVTGFSGTNDTKVLLPLPIVQNDLPELVATNENNRKTLMRAENNNYKNLAANISGMEILVELNNVGIPVLLDAGALMLELNNEQVAREWLKIVSRERYDAAIYFSKDDIMLTIDRNDSITEFEYSAYRERLDRCIVYMDDVHTRGTDLKIPRDTQACVTLSGGITHDKMIQACMRMRLLGQGHCISFWASHEVHIGIRKSSGKSDAERITTIDVIKYASENSEKFKKDFMSYWLSASLNYAQKMAAHKSLAASVQLPPMERPSMEKLLNELRIRCSISEKLKLIDLYGAKTSVTLRKIARSAFVTIENEHESNDTVLDWIHHEIERAVEEKLRTHARDESKNTYIQFLDGECQQELEYELEENREVYRPKTQKPHKPQFNTMLAKLFGASDGRWNVFEQMKEKNDIQPLPKALKYTKLYKDAKIEQNLDAWDSNLWVTKDFLSVIQVQSDDNYDEFLRPVWWVVRIHNINGQHCLDKDEFVLISPFECNELISEFRNGQCHSTLHMFSAKLSPTQCTLINNHALQLPSNSMTRPIPLETIVQLSMFAGSMYFDSAEEELEYCNFMGIIPDPITAEQAKTLKSILPMKTCGYIPSRYREYFTELWCRFKQNPGKIALGIIEMRHGYARKRSHAAQIIIESKRFKWDDAMDVQVHQ